MAERGESSDEEPTIADDVVVTKYKMAGDMCNREFSYKQAQYFGYLICFSGHPLCDNFNDNQNYSGSG